MEAAVGFTPVFRFPLYERPVRAGRPRVSKLDREWRAVYERGVALDLFAMCGPTVREVATAAAEHFKIEPWRLFVQRRHSPVVRSRLVAMVVVRRRGKLSYPDIGRRFGGFDHSTVMRAVCRAPEFVGDIASVEAILDRQGAS